MHAIDVFANANCLAYMFMYAYTDYTRVNLLCVVTAGL